MNDRLKEFLICKGTELAKELPKHDEEMIQVGWEASRIFTLKEVGKWLEKQHDWQSIYLIDKDEVEAFKRGEMPNKRR